MTLYLGLLSALSFLCYGFDKLAAKRSTQRMPERTLLLLAMIGGAAGALLAMVLFRHKIRKRTFRVVVPFSLFFWLILWAKFGLSN